MHSCNSKPLATFGLFIISACFAAATHGADYVIAVSFDGMGSSYMQTLIDSGKMPHLKQIMAQGAGTTNARTDYDVTVTLPNHTTMITSRPINGEPGHNWSSNTDPAKGVTLHSHKGHYVASVFDVAHDNGRKTGLWATKTKFELFSLSYDATNGAPDITGPDNGRDKVDLFTYKKSSIMLTDLFIDSMTTNPCNFAFVHFGEADAAGHTHNWGSEEYFTALTTLDTCLGRIMALMTIPPLKGNSVLIVTADHGGVDNNHSDSKNPLDYTIPFYIWGQGIAQADLYAINQTTRANPGTGRPNYSVEPQPIRNGDVGNLALALLGLGPIPGAPINAKQDLHP
jgi:predicted AlkP superfamily pyrophosphatase or phosphodiesterase